MIDMACSIQNPSILSVALSIPCKYLNSCLKWVLQDLTTEWLASVLAYLFALMYVSLLHEIIYIAYYVACALHFLHFSSR